jgi:hypothetical protein
VHTEDHGGSNAQRHRSSAGSEIRAAPRTLHARGYWLGSSGSTDAELIAVAADYSAAIEEIRRLEGLSDRTPDEAFEPLDARRYAAIDRAAELDAATVSGLQAKASMLASESELGWPGIGSDRQALLAISLGHDVVGGMGDTERMALMVRQFSDLPRDKQFSFLIKAAKHYAEGIKLAAHLEEVPA